MPTDKLMDVSQLALRMSSPFNSGYWLAAAEGIAPTIAHCVSLSAPSPEGANFYRDGSSKNCLRYPTKSPLKSL